MTSWAKFNKHNNLPNALSVLRALLGFTLPFMLLTPDRNLHVLAVVVFTFAALTDYWDGLAARRMGLVSDVGKILDPTADKILTLSTLGAFSAIGFFSPWWLVPIFAREIIITFCRFGWLLQGKAAQAEKLGKLKLVIQVTLLASAFLELMTLDFEGIARFHSFFRQSTFVLLIVTNFLTLFSGVTFLRTNRTLFHDPTFSKFISACGVGLLSGMPGTWGSLLGLAFLPLIAWNLWLYLASFAFVFWAGYWAVNKLDLSAVKDPQFVVIDEVLGIWLAFAFVPVTFLNLLLAFVLFRLFDIFKPFPCRRLEKLPGYWGITADDLGAGLYSCIVLHLFFV